MPRNKCLKCGGYCEIKETTHIDSNQYNVSYICNVCGKIRTFRCKANRGSLSRKKIKDMTPDELMEDLELINKEIAVRGLGMLF